MEKIDLIEILHGDIERIDHVDASVPELSNVDITVYPQDVKNMLMAFLDGHISSVDLTKWSAFLCLRSGYCEYHSDHGGSDALADYYEAMWYVVQRLSTPKIDGEVNEARVRQYLSELDKYEE